MTDTKPTRAFDVQVNSHRDSIILVRGQDVFELRDVEGLIWSRCDGANTVADIVSEVVECYDVDRATAETDVRDFLGDLSAAQLVEPS